MKRTHPGGVNSAGLIAAVMTMLAWACGSDSTDSVTSPSTDSLTPAQEQSVEVTTPQEEPPQERPEAAQETEPQRDLTAESTYPPTPAVEEAVTEEATIEEESRPVSPEVPPVVAEIQARVNEQREMIRSAGVQNLDHDETGRDLRAIREAVIDLETELKDRGDEEAVRMLQETARDLEELENEVLQ